MYKFRELQPNECRILFVRHGEHVNQVVVPEDAEKLRRMGIALAKAGVVIGEMVSSPEPRALRTGLEILAGADQTPRVHTKNDLGDISYTPGLDKTAIKAAAKAAGMEAEQYLLVAPELADVMDSRGADGRNAIVSIAYETQWKNVLVPSHGGSRMEVTLLSLLNVNIASARRQVAEGSNLAVLLMPRCGMVELIMDGGKLIWLCYLSDEDLGITTEATT